jgi:hypothetical protein
MSTPTPEERAAELRHQVLRLGTWASCGLAFLCIVGAGGLCVMLLSKGLRPEGADPLVLKLVVSCVATFVAMGFGCLGFGLFLIHAEGAFRAGGDGTGWKGRLETSAPGLVVFVCATVILVVAMQNKFEYTTRTTSSPAEPAAQADRSEPRGGFMDVADAPPVPAPAAVPRAEPVASPADGPDAGPRGGKMEAP